VQSLTALDLPEDIITGILTHTMLHHVEAMIVIGVMSEIAERLNASEID
jgi:hypothetical protein